MQSGARDTGTEAPQDPAARDGHAMSYIDSRLPLLERGRAAVGAWRRQNPVGTDDQLTTEVGSHFPPDWDVVLRGMLFRYDLDHAGNTAGARP